MAKVNLQFLCTEDKNCHLEVETLNDEIDVSIYEYGRWNSIRLDVSTAIKLHKTLRTEINKAKEGENGRG